MKQFIIITDIELAYSFGMRRQLRVSADGPSGGEVSYSVLI